MDLIKQWILSLCGATAISGLFQVFLSNSNLKKTINIFLSIFILFYTIIPLSNIPMNQLDFEFSNTELGELTEETYENVIKMTIEEICVQNSVDVISIDIDSYINDDYLYVNNISVTIDKSEKSGLIESQLKEKLGFEVSVY